MNKKQFEQIERHARTACYGMLSSRNYEIVCRLCIKSCSNTARYKHGNLAEKEYRMLQLELLDVATIGTTLDMYVDIVNAIYRDCESVGVNL